MADIDYEKAASLGFDPSFVQERPVPEVLDPGTLAFARWRYELLKEDVRGKGVLDAGCGVGWGASLLSDSARAIAAGDIEPRAIAYGRLRYATPNTSFLVMDCARLPFRNQSFEIVVALDSLEHLPPEEQEPFIQEVCRVLCRPGLLLLSTPNRGPLHRHLRSIGYVNPFHTREFSPLELRHLLEGYFPSVRLYGVRKRGPTWYTWLRRWDVLNLRLWLSHQRRDRIVGALGLLRQQELSWADLVLDAKQVAQSHTLMAYCYLQE